MKFKGYELIKDINVLAIGTIIKSEDGKIYILNKKEDGTRTFSRKDRTNRRFCCYTSLQKEYEILEDTTEEIKEITINGRDVKYGIMYNWLGNCSIHEEKICSAIDTLAMKYNELVRAVNKLNKQDTSKETNCMTD